MSLWSDAPHPPRASGLHGVNHRLEELPEKPPSFPPRGGHPLELSPRENEALRHFSTGFTYAQIATRMGISHHTVDTYLRRVREKSGVWSGAELVRLAMGLEMVGDDKPEVPVSVGGLPVRRRRPASGDQ